MTTAQDLITEASYEAGTLGQGQNLTSYEINSAFNRLNWMINQWARKRWLIYRTVDCSVVSTGAQSYTIGPGGNIANDTDGNAISVRPDRIEAAFFRQIVVQTGANQVDYPVQILESREDYNLIALKKLQSFASYVFYDPAWPLGVLYYWPVPQPTIYEVHATLKAQLTAFASVSTVVNLPPEYYGALLYNLALRIRSRSQITALPGDPLPGLAKDALNVLRGANTAISRLHMPGDIVRPGMYNIYSDQIR